jgi:tRNA A37 threonylcarbamoyladenosine dehydratase
MEEFRRSEMLLGAESMKKLADSRVAVFGVGGVGSYVTEALARCGIGHLMLVDSDTVAVSNINRQLIALHSTVGRLKIEVARDRVLDINPSAEVELHRTFLTSDNIDEFGLERFDYIVDAIDTVSAKLALAVRADKLGVPIISCMGAGNKLDPTRFEVTDIYRTSVCPLARVMRTELRRRGVKSLKVVYSTEAALVPAQDDAPESPRRQTPGSVSFVPSVAGLIAAGEVVRDLITRGDRA